MQIAKDDSCEIVAYALTTLKETENRYSQIEKGVFAFAFATKYFIIEIEVMLETDHKPLLQVLLSK